MVKGAKGKTNDSFGSQLAREFFRSVCQCWRLTLARLVLKWKKLDPNQHQKQAKNHNVSWATVHVQL